MAIKDHLPWNRPSEKNELIPLRNQTKNELDALEQPWEHWIDALWRDPFGWPLANQPPGTFRSISPAFDVSESDTDFLISADFPGLEVKDFTITLEMDHLVISGEKKMEKKEKGHTYTRIGRMYGTFQQKIPINTQQIDTNKIQATYKDGVLRIRLQKKPEISTKSRKIPIKST